MPLIPPGVLAALGGRPLKRLMIVGRRVLSFPFTVNKAASHVSNAHAKESATSSAWRVQVISSHTTTRASMKREKRRLSASMSR